MYLPQGDRKPLTRKQRAEIALRQDGKCHICGQKLGLKGTIDEHLVPLWCGGTNDLDNRALVCVPCAKAKTKGEAAERGKVLRSRDKHLGVFKKKGRPFPGSRRSKFKKRMDGSVTER